MAVLRYVFLSESMAPLVSAVSSLLPTSTKIPMWTLEGTVTDSVSTVIPLLSCVDLYSAGCGLKVLASVLRGVWIEARMSPSLLSKWISTFLIRRWRKRIWTVR